MLSQMCAADDYMHLELLLLTWNFVLLVMSCRRDSCETIVTLMLHKKHNHRVEQLVPGTGLCLIATNGMLQLACAYMPVDVCAAVEVLCLQHETNICQRACA